ncbi:hypothetical protein AVEN_246329-1 [Araneus ventricosus]|uniref:Tc1-like transposase DDE domain-containing protein n=1 Tax=Araneus ventricosus TaxID=182803 RepID=A0A4Y2WZR0_ARAVE|nr:hypothetical protein AVEN_246329-1 [Araneus ventricosus]
MLKAADLILRTRVRNYRFSEAVCFPKEKYAPALCTIGWLKAETLLSASIAGVGRDLGGAGVGGHTDLNVFQGGTLTGARYRDEIFDLYVRPYAGAIGNDFILMDDNARPHRAVVVEDILRITIWNEWNGQLNPQT